MILCSNNMKRALFVLFLACFFIISNDVSAQYLGTSTNYSGSRGRSINPSLMTTSFVYADFGLNLGVIAYNDVIYLHASDYQSFMRREWVTSDYYIHGKKFEFGIDLNGRRKSVYEALDFNILSAMYNPNGKTAWGFFVNSRVYANGTRIPWEIAEAGAAGIEEGDFIGHNFVSKNTKIGLMAWSEIGLSYSRVVRESFQDKIDVGVTAKGLLGHAGVGVNLNRVEKSILNRDSAMIHKLDMTAVMSGPVDYSARFEDGDAIFNPAYIVSGLGAGFDIGVTYTRKREDKIHPTVKRPCTAKRDYYYWRIGASLLDVGAISFFKNTQNYNLQSDEDKLFDVTTLEGVETFDQMMDTLCSVFYDDPSEAKSEDGYLMGLPTAASLQFDYSITKNFYVNATWIQPLRFFKYSARRAAMLVVEPRYESRYFDFAVPVTLYNYQKIFVGAEARLAFLTIGTHNIFNFIGVGESYGLDVYVALKFNLYKEKCFGSDRDACWNADFR